MHAYGHAWPFYASSTSIVPHMAIPCVAHVTHDKLRETCMSTLQENVVHANM